MILLYTLIENISSYHYFLQQGIVSFLSKCSLLYMRFNLICGLDLIFLDSGIIYSRFKPHCFNCQNGVNNSILLGKSKGPDKGFGYKHLSFITDMFVEPHHHCQSSQKQHLLTSHNSSRISRYENIHTISFLTSTSSSLNKYNIPYHLHISLFLTFRYLSLSK